MDLGGVWYGRDMLQIKTLWRSLAVRARALAVAGLVLPLILILAAGWAVMGSLGARPPSVPSPSVADVAALPTDAPSPTPSATPTAAPSASLLSPSPSASGPDALLGTDGRLTVLLMGSDNRPSHPGHRTDAIMVVSVDPTTGQSAAFSIPRDTQRFPMPKSGTYGPKVNALYQHLQATTGRGAAGMKAAVSRAFGLEVDNYVLIGFTGVKDLVAAVGGVDVTLEKSYYDAYYWVNANTRGWGLPKGTSHLGPRDALIFARSRKGDNDFGRARRQQLLVMAAVEKVRKRGVDDLPKLLKIAQESVRTDLPVERVGDLFDLFAQADLDRAKRVVFGPRTYATSIGGSAFALDLDACRDWIKRNFPPARDPGS